MNDNYNKDNTYADNFINMLFDFNNMGGLMRRVMTNALTNPQVSIPIYLKVFLKCKKK